MSQLDVANIFGQKTATNLPEIIRIPEQNPYVQTFNKVTKTISLYGDDVEAKRKEIRQYFHDTFTLYEKLFEVLKSDDVFYLRPGFLLFKKKKISSNTKTKFLKKKLEPLRHPLVFYFGHTAAFFINKLVLGKYLYERVNPRIESLVAVGVDEMSWDDLNDTHYDWPTIPELRNYRK